MNVCNDICFYFFSSFFLSFPLFFSELCLGMVTVAYAKPKQRKKEMLRLRVAKRRKRSDQVY